MSPIISVAFAALLAAAAADFDTIFLKNGGRVLGTIVEEDPARGVSIRLPGGEQRDLKPAEVHRIRYGDGTVKTYGDLPMPAQPAPPPPAPASAEPQPPAPPTSPVEPVPEGAPVAPAEPFPPYAGPETAAPGVAPMPPETPGPITLAASLFRLFPGGDVEASMAMKDFTTAMTGLGLEAGLRLTPKFLVGGSLDMAFGRPGPALEAWCGGWGMTCDTADVKLGLMARYAFTPAASSTPWVGVGVAFDVLMALSDATEQTPSYGGGEPRLSAGWDLRLNRTIGVGAFVTASTSRYPDVDRGDGEIVPIDRRARHTWLQLGVRGILFP
jgi:hypothetical protein